MVDAANLAAGHATPVLTTHIVMTLIAYPIFAAATIALIVAGVRHRALGSLWIAWIGCLGALGHGLSVSRA